MYQLKRKKVFLPNAPLVCDGNQGRQGACVPYFSCDNYEGDVEGTCRVVGQCCVVKRSCGQTSSARITYFNDDRLSIAEGTTCSTTITTSEAIGAPAICQLHVTIDELKLSEPTAEGVCEDQYLMVRGGKEDSIKICGTNKNQTLVVDVEGREGPFKVSVVSTNENLDSDWQVKVVQVPCDDQEQLAPSGCDQYLTGLTGALKSFNYDTEPSSITQDNGKPGSRHLQESYTICVRPEEGYCGLQWIAPADEDYAFTLTGNLQPDGADVVFGTSVNEDCAFTDYLIVADANIEGENHPTVVICGSKFPDALKTTSYKIRVVTNDKEFDEEDIDNRGFHLLYSQQKCEDAD